MKYSLISLSLVLSLIFFCSKDSISQIGNPDASTGVILGKIVNIRERPDLKSKIVAQVKEGDHIPLIEWTDKRETIDDNNEPWVKTRLDSGVSGYLYGAFVFDLGNFYGRYWSEDTCSGVIVRVKFFNTNRYEFIEGCAEPGCGDPEVTEKGAFTIAGRKIILFKQHGKRMYIPPITELYLLKHSGKNILTETRKGINDRSYIKSDTCWGWKQ